MCDYLSSHRSCLPHNLLHNYRVLLQSKIIYTKLVSIIVLDALLSMAPELKENEYPSKNNSIRKVKENASMYAGSKHEQSEEEPGSRAKTTRMLRAEQSEGQPISNRAASSILQ